MKTHIKQIIRQAKQDGNAEITAFVMAHFKDQGFELVAKKDLKAMEKLNKLYKSQIADLVHDNWEIQMRLYEVELGAKDRPYTNRN
jgi:hypothetical protein